MSHFVPAELMRLVKPIMLSRHFNSKSLVNNVYSSKRLSELIQQRCVIAVSYKTPRQFNIYSKYSTDTEH